VAYAFINNLRLSDKELVTLENEIAAAGDNAPKGVQAWLKENQDVVQPAIDAAKKEQ
jgi:ABC-type proline/glycine betaine transport system substrate-binding protein